jgi:erythromycin esterase-like protein
MRRTPHSIAALFLAACAASPGATPAPAPAFSSASAIVAPVASAIPAPDTRVSSIPPEVNAFVHDHAHALRSIDPGGSRDDLAWLRDVASRARVVGLGEQSHGTHEHARLKQRLIEMLVCDAGFTALAIEAPMLEIADLDGDVKNSGGDLGRDAVSLGFWSWKIDEMFELLGWIRSYNAEPTTKRKVSVYGFDMQKTPRATAVLLRYLDSVDPARAKRLRPVLAILANPFAMADYAPRWMKDIDAIAAAMVEP